MASAVKSRPSSNVSKVSRWGNSLGLRLPREAVDSLKLKAGEAVSMSVTGDSIVIRKAKTRKKWTEAELLKGVTPGICGPELIPDTVGREIV